ncbi:hypothetical protein JVT61DRAFT_10352 [Boletus reticuloceps]|uniref:Uncharacterized protein n=1 Tax=Boletus reticuloceps TaxID=495285 RepID=A0A8I2Z048_9AGAM|nr:hypothetical protein JVT61DRAFT_10352 [Boletus reticuloceps]
MQGLSPIALPYSPPGRSTCGFVAYVLARKKKVYLKDTWQVDVVSIEQESEIYKLLHEKQVRNIPRCIAAGDVLTDLYHATKTQEYVAESWACPPCSGSEAARLNSYRLYRLVLDDVRAKLMKFRSSHELVQAVSNALDGEDFAGGEHPACHTNTIFFST